MLIDTHAHLNFSSFKDDLDEVIERTNNLGMKVINVGSQQSTSQRAVEIAKKYPEICYAAVGLHPIHLFNLEVDIEEMPFVTRQEEFKAEAYRKMAKQPGVVAIGEVGLDYFHMPTGLSVTEFKTKQKWAFLKQLQLAKELDLPVILHCRGDKEDEPRAYHDLLAILKEFGYFKAVVHCFTAEWDVAKAFLDHGCMLSFTGIVTYKKTEKLATVIKKTPLDRMMVETDSPYLAPQIVRGQRNEPRFVQYVASRIAELKGLEYNEVEEKTTENAIKFFNLP